MPRGFKSCLKCHKSVGPRTKVCECGHNFTFKPGKEPKAPNVPSRVPPHIPKRGSPPQVKKPLENLSDDPPKVIAVTDRDEVQEFIQQLKSCYERSHRNGGGYSAFLHHKTGTLQVDVCLKMRLS